MMGQSDTYRAGHQAGNTQTEADAVVLKHNFFFCRKAYFVLKVFQLINEAHLHY